MARPRKADADKRCIDFRVAVSSKEAAAIHAQAEAAGLRPSDYARQMLQHGRVVVRQSPGVDYAVAAQLNRIGVNIHQIVRNMNIHGERPPDYLETLCFEIETIITESLDRGSA